MRRLNKYILGPCSLESFELCNEILLTLSKLDINGEFWFKGSYDKANRTSINSKRGPGLSKGIDIFKEIHNLFPDIKLTTDVHDVWGVNRLNQFGIIDMIQIPAFLCRQTDLILECAKYFNTINIKKGQWLSPKQMKYVVEKIRSVNKNATVYITERGTSFGYNKLLVDFSAVNILKDFCDGVFLDCTHSTQGSFGKTTGGDRELAKKYALSANIFEYDGVFIETHPNPNEAISDKDSQIELEWIKDNIHRI